MSDKIPHVGDTGRFRGVQQGRIGIQGNTKARISDIKPGDKLSSPFPYYGGKSRWIDTVFARIGKVGVWSEPLCGTAVMTLNNPEPAPREVICELNAFICNFFRSTRWPTTRQTAYHADWPTIHQDLTARHRWLLALGRGELRERVSEDA